jgi:FkbH-like protein
VSSSNADAERTKQYQVEAKRAAVQKSFTNEADFLQTLKMISEVKNFDKYNIPRIAQLSQRSNQFNLRTIRYTESEIEEISTNDYFNSLTFTLSDKFGENGLVCVVILEKQTQDTLFINTWLMSCRVLKRGMENFTLNTIVKYAIENGFKNIIGEFISTPKNEMVKDHYVKLGFVQTDDKDHEFYALSIENYISKECYITTKQ